MVTVLDSRLSKVQVMSLAQSLHNDECGIADMFNAMRQTDNPRIAYNAAWVLTHLTMEDKRLYLSHRYVQLVSLATSEALHFRRGLVLSILEDFPVEDKPNTTLLDFCLTHITDIKESDSSRSCMIRLAARMCKPYPELCNELMLVLEMLSPNTSKSIECAKRKALEMII